MKLTFIGPEHWGNVRQGQKMFDALKECLYDARDKGRVTLEQYDGRVVVFHVATGMRYEIEQ